MTATSPQYAVPQGPYPITATVGAQIPRPADGGQLRYIQIANSSPYTVTITAGRALGQIGAFNADVFELPASSSVVSVQPVAGSGLVVAGTDSNVYATWSDTHPVGTFPVPLGAASVTATPTQLLGTFAVSVAAPNGVQTFNVSPASYHTALVLMYDDQSTTPSPITARVDQVGMIQAPSLLWGNGQFPPIPQVGVNQLVVPIVGAAGDCAITVQHRDTGAGLTHGTLFVLAVAAPVVTHTIATQPIQTLGSAETTVAAGTTVNVKPAAESGVIHRVKLLTWRLTATPAGATPIVWKLDTLNQAFCGTEATTAAGGQDRPIPLDFYTVDGISVTNSTSVAVVATALWEVWPIGQTPG